MIHRWLTACAAGLLAIAVARDGFEDWVNETRLPLLAHAVSTEVVDANGYLLRAYPVENGRWRMATTSRDVDPTYLKMLFSIEDKRFSIHRGVDSRAIVRAFGQAVWNGRIVSGGSTLTMQAARLIENSGTGGWSGKLRQVRVALALEQRLNKDDILTLYLTHAPFGGNVEGVRAASYAWFDKPPKRLSAAEAALLIALPQAPETRRPDRNPQQAKHARDRILQRLGRAGTTADIPRVLHRVPRLAPHLTDRARGASPQGRVLQVTLDADVQRKMQALSQRAVQNLPREVSAAILVADHHTGAIQAYVGAAQYGDAGHAGFVDMVRAQRSPGSTLKPLIYALAFDQGLAHPDTLISDRPVAFGAYTPQNFDGQFRGDITVRRALELSLNIPPVLLTDAMGPHRLMAALRKGGADPQLAGGQPGLAIALGGLGLSLEDLVQLYAGLAQGGQAVPLHWMGPTQKEPLSRLVSGSAAWQVGHILAGIQPPQGQPLGHVAFKTGTSYGHRDAWAIGWDGRHVIGVWLGRPDGTPVPGIFGGDIAAPILFEAFGRLKPTLHPLPVPPPETLIQSTALLPKVLQRFSPRSGVLDGDDTGPELAFPPDGARFRVSQDQGVVVKLKGGTPPFAVLANERPVHTSVHAREIELRGLRPGFSTLRVIDATGRSDRVNIRLD
ncbi:MAG: penicillin-binding protein 1C [Aliishimia sp.]